MRLRSKIKATSKEYGPNFTSDQLMHEHDCPIVYRQWFYFSFLGLDGHTIWDCYLETAANAYWKEVDSLAFKKSWQLCPRDESGSFMDEFIPVYCETSGKLLHYTMREQPKLPELGDKTRSEFIRDYASKLIQEDEGDMLQIAPYFKFTWDREHGKGLHAVVDASCITREVIEATITNFQAFGEIEWQDVKPVERCKLPSDTFENLAKTSGQ